MPPLNRITINATTATRSTVWTGSRRCNSGQIDDATAAAPRKIAGRRDRNRSVSFVARTASANAAAPRRRRVAKSEISVMRCPRRPDFPALRPRGYQPQASRLDPPGLERAPTIRAVPVPCRSPLQDSLHGNLAGEWLRRWRLVEAKLSVSEVLSIVVCGVVGAPEVQLVGHVVMPAVGVLERRNVAGQSVHEDEEPACRTAIGTRVVSGTVFAKRSAACVEHKVVRDRASHLLQKQTTSDPYELAQAGGRTSPSRCTARAACLRRPDRFDERRLAQPGNRRWSCSSLVRITKGPERRSPLPGPRPQTTIDDAR